MYTSRVFTEKNIFMARFFNGPYHHNNPPVVMSVLRPGLLGAGFATYTKKKDEEPHAQLVEKENPSDLCLPPLYLQIIFLMTAI